MTGLYSNNVIAIHYSIYHSFAVENVTFVLVHSTQARMAVLFGCAITTSRNIPVSQQDITNTIIAGLNHQLQ
jgi:hypothetical protein